MKESNWRNVILDLEPAQGHPFRVLSHLPVVSFRLKTPRSTRVIIVAAEIHFEAEKIGMNLFRLILPNERL